METVVIVPERIEFPEQTEVTFHTDSARSFMTGDPSVMVQGRIWRPDGVRMQFEAPLTPDEVALIDRAMALLRERLLADSTGSEAQATSSASRRSW